MKRKNQAIVYHGFTTSLGALKCADMLFGGTLVTNKHESAMIVSSMIPNLLINMVSWSSCPPVPPYDMNVYLYIYLYGSHSKSPCRYCRDCWLQRPPVLQHWTPRFFFSEFAKVNFYLATVYFDEVFYHIFFIGEGSFWIVNGRDTLDPHTTCNQVELRTPKHNSGCGFLGWFA